MNHEPHVINVQDLDDATLLGVLAVIRLSEDIPAWPGGDVSWLPERRDRARRLEEMGRALIGEAWRRGLLERALADVTCPQCDGFGRWLPKARENVSERPVSCIYCVGSGRVSPRLRDDWMRDYPEGR